VDADLDTLATALYVTTDDLLKAHPEQVPWRPAVGIQPRVTDAEIITLAVMQALLSFTSEARFLRYANKHQRQMFPVLPGQSGYNKRLRKLAHTMAWLKIRDPAAADRWTWLIIACHARLCLARTLAGDLRRPRERPAPPGRLTPARARRGFRNIRAKAAQPAGAPKPGKPGPGRPPGSKNGRPAPRHDAGKTTTRELTLKDKRERAGSTASFSVASGHLAGVAG